MSQELMNKSSWFFKCSQVLGKLKVAMSMYMVKYGCDLLGPVSLKSASSQE